MPGPPILFDLDGCLVDSLPSIVRCWAETLPEFDLPVPDATEIRRHVGPPVDVAARSFAPPDASASFIDRLVHAYRRRSVAATDVDLFPGVSAVLTGLAGSGRVLAIATSKSIEVVEPLLQRLDLVGRFAVVEGTRRDELGTDKTTIVGRAIDALGELGLGRPEVLVGDREHDVVGAHACGLAAIGVLWGYGGRAELEAAGAEFIVATPQELAARLGQ